jgi:hypothetical protein
LSSAVAPIFQGAHDEAAFLGDPLGHAIGGIFIEGHHVLRQPSISRRL